MNKQQNPIVIALIVAGAFLGYRVLTGKFEQPVDWIGVVLSGIIAYFAAWYMQKRKAK